MRSYPLRILVLLVITTAFLGCTSPEPSVYSPEPLPEVLESLPRRAKVLCLGDSPPDKGSVVLWSLPGRVAPDTESGVSGYSGDELAWMGHCEPVQITEPYWDPYGAEYWVKIEYFDTVGWVRLELISFETALPSAESIVPIPSSTAVDAQPNFYLLYQAGREQKEIYQFDFASSRPVAPGDLVAGQPLSPDQKRLVITTRPASKKDSTRSYAVLHLEQGTTEPLPLIAPSSHLFWSPDGRQLMYASYPEDKGQLVVYDFEKGENVVLVDEEAVWNAAGWSADGEMAAFVAVTDGQYDLYLLEMDSLAVHRLTDTKDIETAAVWSPVSNELLVGTTVYTEHALYLWPFSIDALSIISSDGQERDLGRYDFVHSPSLSWSADGERVAYSEKGTLCILSLSAGQRDCPLVDLEPYGTYHASFGEPPVWSPDNRWLAFRAAGYREQGCDDEVYALELAMNKVVVVEEGSCETGDLYWVGE